MFKIAGCAGHGGFGVTPGKRTPDGEYEWTFNDKVIKAFIEEIKKYKDVEFLRTDDPTGKTDVALKTRTDKANSWGADFYISFHHNANAGKWGTHTGVETYTQTGVGGEALKLAKALHPELVKAYGLRDRGLRTSNLHITRETKMPAILVEGGFMDSSIDIKKLRDDKILKAVGVNMATALAKYKGLKLKDNLEPSPDKPSGDTYTVKSGDTLYAISKSTGVSVDDLMEFNKLKTSLITVGQVLLLKKPKDIDPVIQDAKYELPNITLALGSVGPEVTLLQKALNAAKFKLKGNVDKYFGEDTLQALKRFQSVYTPYDIDGIYGTKTKKALNELLNK